MAKEPLTFHAALSAAAGLLGLLGALWLGESVGGRLSALLGVGLSAMGGAAALPLKQWAMGRSLQAAFQVMGLLFLLRLLWAAGGVVLVRLEEGSTLAYVLGYLAVYLAQQWIEISFVLAEQRRRRGA